MVDEDLRLRVEASLAYPWRRNHQLIHELWARLQAVLKDRRECIDYWGRRAEKAEDELARFKDVPPVHHDDPWEPVTAEMLADPVPLTTNQAQTILNALGTLYRQRKT
jgi:hypothetical protein